MSDDLFDHNEEFEIESDIPEIDQSKEYLSELVGEGKKYRDLEALAKAAVHKDAFIEQLKREQAEARAVIQERINMEQFLNELKAAKKPVTPPSESVTTPTERSVEASAVTPEKIEEIIAAREAKQKRLANRAKVEQSLMEAYGERWKQEVRKKAAELEVSTTYLTEIAERSPKAFFDLVPVERKAGDAFTPPPRGSVSSPPVSSSSKNYAYYQKMRQEKGESWYFSPQTRQEIWKELQAQGEDTFYKK